MEDIKRQERVTVRFTQDEKKLVELFASDHGRDISKLVREATLYYINVTTEHNQLLEESGAKEVESSGKAIRDVLDHMKQVLIKSIEHSHQDLDEQLEEVKRQLDAFVYTYLFHTPEIKADKKQEAKQSALERKKRVEILMKG